MLWNRFDELAGDVRDGLRRRFHTIVDAADLDEDRARDWLVLRMVHNASWTIHEAIGPDRALTGQGPAWPAPGGPGARAVPNQGTGARRGPEPGGTRHGR